MPHTNNLSGGYINVWEKGNRRVIPSCVLWKIRNLFPEQNGVYIPYSEGEHD